jgi:flavin-dependent dehydrogenase
VERACSASGPRRPAQADFLPGLELHGKYTFLAEGVRGSLSKLVIDKFGLTRTATSRSTASG